MSGSVGVNLDFPGFAKQSAGGGWRTKKARRRAERMRPVKEKKVRVAYVETREDFRVMWGPTMGREPRVYSDPRRY